MSIDCCSTRLGSGSMLISRTSETLSGWSSASSRHRASRATGAKLAPPDGDGTLTRKQKTFIHSVPAAFAWRTGSAGSTASFLALRSNPFTSRMRSPTHDMTLIAMLLPSAL